MDTRKATIILIAFILSVVVIFVFLERNQYKEIYSIGKEVTSFKDLSDRFVALAQDKGAEYAFEVLRQAQLPPQTDLHLLGHFVGDELYKQKGVDGIQMCTPDFRNACSHTIVIGTLAEFGDGALPLIRDACRKAPGGPGAYTMCFHGLGHGVFAGYGYEFPETIEFCKLTGTKEYHQQEYIECFGGAIMEFTGGGDHDPQLIEESREKYITGPLQPCMSDVVPPELRGICLTYLTPQIWQAAGISLASPDESKFAEAFSYCEDIAVSELKESCYAGFGKEFIPLAGQRDIRDISNYTNSDFMRAIRWCSYAGNSQGEAWCINEGLDSIFWGGENNPDASFRYCSLVGGVAGKAQEKSCENKLAWNILFYIKDEGSRKSFCGRLSKNVQDICLEDKN